MFIGKWQVDAEHYRLRSDEGDINLRQKVMQVLLHLAKHHDRLVTREELIEAIWDGNEAVGERALTNAIWQLRASLGKPPEKQECIQTVPKSGYQLLLPVTANQQDVPDKGSLPSKSRFTQWAGFSTLVLALILIWSFWPKAAPSWETAEVIVQTRDQGMELQPALSPDGKWFAYVFYKNRQYDLYLKAVGESAEKATQLTHHPDGESDPQWSKDGRTLLFKRSDGEKSCGIYSIEIATLEERLRHNCNSFLYTKASWHPDGESLIIYDKREGMNRGGLFVLSADGQNKTQLNVPGTPRYVLDGASRPSPTDNQIAFLHSESVENHDLYLLTFPDQKITRLTFDHGLIHGFTWSADGRSIIFSSNRDGDWHLWEVPTQGGIPKPLNIQGGNPSTSSQGTVLLYEVRQHNWQLSKLDLKHPNAPLTALNVIEDLTTTTPNPQPNGQFLYTKTDNVSTQFLLAEESGKISKRFSIPANYNNISDAFLSASGEWLAFLAKTSVSEHLHIHLLNVESGQVRQLSQDASDHFALRWRADDKQLMASTPVSGRWELWNYPLKGEPQRFTYDGGGLLREWHNRQFYSKADTNGIWERLDDAQERLVVPTLKVTDWANWDLNEDGIYYLFREEEYDKLMLQAFDNPVPTEVARFPAGTVPGYGRFSIDTQSRKLYLITNRVLEADIYARFRR
ncbi:winged helix-turn-helix domain-containing protein [Aliiglaciecola sp. CAU 1673]|uniref:winged helix-turn-helix domain-containing protein n=1 Tax=Aliiglaciecola sp. CAU 1673 TaxID=3032595 RepID=UPI0023DA559B|nr:winged helix-turn-helix domain-containing protein [Aliiglaciecola sp. CAU 1673]MDF2179017.1 winged helix-turn-helix domain-containing protein [Aliiglaciecola sp. CAU 1673]